MDDLVEIADDERSRGLSSSKLSSSPGTSLPELEDQENIPLINYENMNATHILPPVGNPPFYVVSGQCAVHSKGVPKSAFHPYRHPLAQLIQCSKTMAGRLHDGPLLRRATSTSSLPSSGGYGVVHSGSDGEINAGHLEEQEVSHRIRQVEEIVVQPERRVLGPWSTHPVELKRENSDDDSS